LDVGGFLGGAFSAELRSGAVFREQAEGDGVSGRDAARCAIVANNVMQKSDSIHTSTTR
jgi:hypothetical protein